MGEPRLRRYLYGSTWSAVVCWRGCCVWLDVGGRVTRWMSLDAALRSVGEDPWEWAS